MSLSIRSLSRRASAALVLGALAVGLVLAVVLLHGSAGSAAAAGTTNPATTTSTAATPVPAATATSDNGIGWD
jgi:hypothetical protein